MRAAIALVGSAFCVVEQHGYSRPRGWAVAIAALGLALVARAPIVFAWTAIIVVATAAVHAVFFGAGRYGLAVVPFVAALAFAPLAPPRAS